MGQLLEQVRLQVSHPHLLDGVVEEGHGGDGLVVLQLPLHDGPEVLDGVEIRRIAGPVHDGEVLRGQEGHHPLGLVAGRPILQEL